MQKLNILMFHKKIEAPKRLLNCDILAADSKPLIVYILIYQSWGISITVPDENQSKGSFKTCPWISQSGIAFSIKSVLIKRALAHDSVCECYAVLSQIAMFMWPTWGPAGSCWPHVGPMLAPWTLLSGIIQLVHNSVIIQQGQSAVIG